MDQTFGSTTSWWGSAMVRGNERHASDGAKQQHHHWTNWRPTSPDIRPTSPDLQSDLGRTTRKGTGTTVQSEENDPINEQHFQKLKRSNLNIKEKFDFMFKLRLTSGRAIHVAALHRDGTKILSALLELGAPVDDPCTTIAEDVDTGEKRNVVLQPIHLAAGRGNVDVVQTLLNNGASVEARAIYDGEPNYCPIHEAAYFQQVTMMRHLLESGADINAVNSKGQTPLHIACAVGSWRSAQLLVESGACLRGVDENGDTALKTAINGRYPDRKLYIIARNCIEDLMEVAKEAPSAAVELLQDTRAWDAWRTGLMDDSHGNTLPTTDHLVTLLIMAPKVAGLFLDVLTVTPPVEDPYHHPMPRHARHDTFNFRLCEYTMDTEWKHYQDESMDQGVGDKFRHIISHRREMEEACIKEAITPDDAEKCRYESRVGRLHVRILKLPNIICFDVLNALSRLKTKEELAVFKRTAVQALLDFSWFHLVRLEYTVNLIIKITELCFLLWVTFKPPRTEEGKQVSWSLLTATVTRSAWTELAQIIGFRKYLNTFQTYFENLWNYVDMGTITVGMVLTWGSIDTLEFSNRELLAVVSFFRWIQFLYSTGAYRFLDIGYKIVPIFESFFQVSGIFVITLFTFLAFFHAFAALEREDGIEPMQILLNAFKLLLVGDGDGIQYILNLGGRGQDGEIMTQMFFYFGVLIFCVCILNLFIAVHGGAYDAESARVTENFYRNRATICLNTMLQPRWRRKLPCEPLKCYLLLMMVALPCWIGMAWIMAHPVVPMLWLLLSFLVGDAILRKRPWKEKNGQPWNFWGEEDQTGSGQLTPKITPIEPLDPPPGSPKPPDGQPDVLRIESHSGGEMATLVEHGGAGLTETLERTGTPHDMKEVSGEPTDHSDKTPTFAVGTIDSCPKPKRKSGMTLPRLKPQMYLWWCSWAEEEMAATEEQNKRDADVAVRDSLKQLNERVAMLSRKEDRSSQVEKRVDGIRRTLAESSMSLSESLMGVSGQLNAKLDSTCRRVDGLEGRLGGLEGHMVELQRSIAQLSEQLRPLCEGSGPRRSAEPICDSPDGRGSGGSARGKMKGGVLVKLRGSSGTGHFDRDSGGDGLGRPSGLQAGAADDGSCLARVRSADTCLSDGHSVATERCHSSPLGNARGGSANATIVLANHPPGAAFADNNARGAAFADNNVPGAAFADNNARGATAGASLRSQETWTTQGTWTSLGPAEEVQRRHIVDLTGDGGDDVRFPAEWGA